MNAVVSVSSVSNITDLGVPGQITLEGTGFLVSERHVITTANLVLVPNIYDRVPPGVHVNMSKQQLIVVGVNNVNGEQGCHYKYRAELVGVDATAGIAILEIVHTEGSPPLECQETLKWGKSRKVKQGSKIQVLTNAEPNYSSEFKGSLARQNVIIPGLGLTPELLSLDIVIPRGSAGAPVLHNGCVIGMVIGLYPETTTYVAISQHAAERIIADIMKNRSVEVINDPLGPFLRHIRSMLGVDTNLVNSLTTYANVLGLIDLDSVTNTWNLIQGIIVVDVLPVSPLFGTLSPGDIITSVRSCSGCVNLGGLECQNTTGNALLNVPTGTDVTVYYRLINENYSEEHCVNVTTPDIPIDFDLINNLDNLIDTTIIPGP
uniref:Trypsin-like peptidase domain containing protein n=1 Tax=viral metagenome TaxID=1070528 RepID=A0A6C0BM41_9ZZZZ